MCRQFRPQYLRVFHKLPTPAGGGYPRISPGLSRPRIPRPTPLISEAPTPIWSSPSDRGRPWSGHRSAGYSSRRLSTDPSCRQRSPCQRHGGPSWPVSCSPRAGAGTATDPGPAPAASASARPRSSPCRPSPWSRRCAAEVPHPVVGRLGVGQGHIPLRAAWSEPVHIPHRYVELMLQFAAISQPPNSLVNSRFTGGRGRMYFGSAAGQYRY